MKLLIASDLHFGFHADNGKNFVESLPDADVLVVAGDVNEMPNDLLYGLRLLCSRWQDVVYVCGNHEFFGSSIKEVRDAVRGLADELPNLHFLDNSIAVINGRKFVGTTLWYRQAPKKMERYMPDFHYIRDASTIYEENRIAMEFLNREVDKDSIVVTHHLPSEECVQPKWKDHALNCFFVCEMDDLIYEKTPNLWIHGHTHESVDFMLDQTRIICNPFGYAGKETNFSFKDLVIDI